MTNLSLFYSLCVDWIVVEIVVQNQPVCPVFPPETPTLLSNRLLCLGYIY